MHTPRWILVALGALCVAGPARAQKLGVGDDDEDGPRSPALRGPVSVRPGSGAVQPPRTTPPVAPRAPEAPAGHQSSVAAAGPLAAVSPTVRRPPLKPLVEAFDDLLEDAVRPVRVRLTDGSTVWGRVHAEQASAIVVETTLGRLAISRGRIATMWYDEAAGPQPDRPITYGSPAPEEAPQGRARRPARER